MFERKIIHIDMDAFYASVEERDDSSLKGKPVIVSGPPESRSVVCTANYEARKFGVHSAMPSSRAKKLCPEGVFVYPRFSVYKNISLEIHEIFHQYTDLVEPLSLDEAYLDVTMNFRNISSATKIARDIKEKIFSKTKLTASAGVAGIKFIAKVASNMNKPNGLTVVTPEQAERFLEELKIGKFYGIGAVTEKKMLSLGIKTGKDLKEFTKLDLIKHFGKSGSFYYHIVRGEDFREVNPYRNRKSIGAENTFPVDILDINRIYHELDEIAEVLISRIKKSSSKGKTITLKVKYANFESISRSFTHRFFFDTKEIILDYAKSLLKQTEVERRKIRLLGITISGLDEIYEDETQLKLF